MRYARQEIFSEIRKTGQDKLRKSTIAIVGIGALGSVSAELLARAGVGTLILIDRDIVELSNLQRQSLYDETDLGKPKALAAKEKLDRINSKTRIHIYIDDLNFKNIDKFFQSTAFNYEKNNKNKKNHEKIRTKENKIDLILDCTDNLETRFLINDFSIKKCIPFIYSSAVASKGYVFTIIPKKTACLRCFLKEATQLDTCETAGVLNSITHLVSSIQSNESIKILLNKKNIGKNLMYFDIWKNELIKINVNKNKNCICCAKGNFEFLTGKKSSKIIKLCGNHIYQIKSKSMDGKKFKDLKSKLSKIGKLKDFRYCINFDDKLTIFQDGRALLKAKDEKEAKSLYSRFVGN